MGGAVSRSVRFALQLGATTAGAVLDYLVGKLTGKLSLGIVSWAVLVVIAAAVLELGKELARDENKASSQYSARAAVRAFLRSANSYRWTTIVRALWAAGFAGIAAFAFILAVITFRFVAVYNGLPIGEHSPFNQAVITFVSNFQASSATAVLIGGSFALGMLLQSEILLPFGIGLVSIANAILIGLPQHDAISTAFRSQIAYSLSFPDELLFRLPVATVPVACAIPFVVGVAACTIVSGLVRT